MAPTSTEGAPGPGFGPDILGDPYTVATMHLRPDAEGEVTAALIRRPADGLPTGKAVLHVHGFCDYFFQTAMADYWCSRGYDFYAVDLRKHGRSLMSHQTPNYVEDLSSYYEELDEAFEAVRSNYQHVVISAHSTGGLTAALWASDRGLAIDGMVLNAPWLDVHGDLVTRRVAMPVLRRVGARRPDLEVKRRVNGIYGRSIHRDYDGEWDFNLAWKPLESWPVYAGWIRAIRQGQIRVSRGIEVPAPVLVLTSARTGRPTSVRHPDATSTDIVLDVEQIRRRAPLLSHHVTIVQVEGALHDVMLSTAKVRDTAFCEVDRFLSAYVDR